MIIRRLVSAYLALNGRYAGVNRGVHVVRQFACPIVQAVVMDRDLGEEAPALNAEGDLGFGLGLEQTVELADLLCGIGSQILGGIHLLLGKSELH